MKRPRQSICSTTPKGVPPALPAINAAPQLLVKDTPIVLAQPPLSITSSHKDDVWNVPLIPNHIPHPNVILDDKLDPSVASIFAFGAFADKNSGIVYYDLIGSFPFVSLGGSVCFFVLYHYESNYILADPIMALDDKTIFEAYRKQFNDLTKKGYKQKLNVMDNQATKYIKQFLDKNECKLQLIEPHNHRVNAAERAIQMFKDAFIAALATTDANFPIQLWNQMTSQIQNTLNMMRASRVNPAILAYESLDGPYNWNRYPLAPLGCKAAMYEDGNTRGSWASWGVNGWYLGPLLDHYQCNVYYVPETRAYHISGLTELFLQHCQLPTLTPHQHLRALTEELAAKGTIVGAKTKGHCLNMLLQKHIGNILISPPPIPDKGTEQRVEQRVNAEQQRVIDNTPIITLDRIIDAPAIMTSRNLTTK
jgi:hypothetical protein